MFVPTASAANERELLEAARRGDEHAFGRLIGPYRSELHQTRPAGLHYATFQFEDGVSFVHLASNESEDGQSPLSEVQAFKRFQENIDDRCEESPVVSSLGEIGSYRLFGE